MEIDKDHIDSFNLKSLIINIKKSVTYHLYREAKSITKLLRLYYFYRNKFFIEGYFVCSIGRASEETIKHYIESQG